MENSIPEKKPVWFGKVQTKEAAFKAIRDSSYGFFFISILQVAASLTTEMNLWFNALLCIILGTALLRFKSRIAAVLLVLFTGSINSGTGVFGILLAIAMILAGFRAVQATFKLHELEKF